MPILPIAQLIGLAIQVAHDTRPIPGSSFEMTVSSRRALDARSRVSNDAGRSIAASPQHFAVTRIPFFLAANGLSGREKSVRLPSSGK
jgi:hypothetical protein